MQEEKAPQQDATAEAASDTPPTGPTGTGQTAGDAAPPAAEDLVKQLEEARAALLYARAEAENIRRRAAEDVQKASRFAVEKFAGNLLAVRDSLEAAVAIPAATTDQVLEGVHATLRQLASALERHKVLEINPPAGTRFDPHHHQAISMVPAEQDANTVVAVLQKGYLIAERVLRPALVTVAAPR